MKTKTVIMLICLGLGVLSGFMVIWGTVLMVVALAAAVLIAPNHIRRFDIWCFFTGFFVGGNINKLIDWPWMLTACIVLGVVIHAIRAWRLTPPELRKG